MRTYFIQLLLQFRCIHSFGDITNTHSARFDGKGSRLLCSLDRNLPVVYNIPREQHQRSSAINEVTGKVQPTATGYSVSNSGLSNCCFAGDDDELVVAPSSINHNLFIWSVPDEGQGDRTIDQSLLSLTGHQHYIFALRYCKAISNLASGDNFGVIKLWTPSSSSP